MDKVEEEVEEYEVYFATPNGKFLQSYNKQSPWYCMLIDTEPTSFFTIKIFRKRCCLVVSKEDCQFISHGFRSPVFCIANGETFSVKERNDEYIFVYNMAGSMLEITSREQIREYNIVLTIEFANQPKHVIK